MILELPYPPSVNKYWRTFRGRMLISQGGREYRAAVVAQLLGIQGFDKDARLAVGITMFPPDRRRRDLDNITKSLLDALGHAGAYADDSQIDELNILRGHVTPPNGRVTVEIKGASNV